MKIPNQIWIRPKVIYEVVYQDQIGDDPDTVGYCDTETKHLYIKNGQKKDEKIRCLIHECLHAIVDENKIKITHAVIHKLEKAIYEYLILNNHIK